MKIVAGTMMASMSQSSINLPKVSYDLPTKLTTILLNRQQIEAIQQPAKHKILTGPFGSGKTVILSEIAKKLLQVHFSFYTLNIFNIVDLILFLSLHIRRNFCDIDFPKDVRNFSNKLL